MDWMNATPQHIPLVLAQQPGAPEDGHREAYEGGKKVGEIAAYVMIGVIVVWALAKLFRRR